MFSNSIDGGITRDSDMYYLNQPGYFSTYYEEWNPGSSYRYSNLKDIGSKSKIITLIGDISENSIIDEYAFSKSSAIKIILKNVNYIFGRAFYESKCIDLTINNLTINNLTINNEDNTFFIEFCIDLAFSRFHMDVNCFHVDL